MDNERLINKMDDSKLSKLKAVVIGGTGATGRELIDILLVSDKISEVAVFGRRTIDRWENLPEDKQKKFKFIEVQELDALNNNKDHIKTKLKDLSGYNLVYCCLGSRTHLGEEIFTRVDYTYVLYSSSLCEKFNIPYFGLVSSVGANANSWFLYMRVKGRVEEELKKSGIKKLSIFRPGIITNRDNDVRCGEKFAACFTCCFASISSRELAQGIYNESLTSLSNQDRQNSITYENNQILELSALHL
jgi:oxidoreductase